MLSKLSNSSSARDFVCFAIDDMSVDWILWVGIRSYLELAFLHLYHSSKEEMHTGGMKKSETAAAK